ncbi:ribonuclease D [Marinobacter sp. X15-166B]|uniref:ribonuclease D n=1 Tax=Marinobacter sp. X15-166B TaxID=1897620 RepID=UPI00085BF3DE|nr:HRDC domain-containing protein [Marinobacter sp. X15-166B]OEY67735.1 3'-5' exonuclease [Marinobacter sp. X15-166B]
MSLPTTESRADYWIIEPAALDQWLESAPGLPLALDTEFERVSTFYPIPGLVQLGLGDRYCLVDPAVAEASPVFVRMLQAPEVPKILYAMSEDLELFRHWLNIEPRGLLDLQVGAALAGAGFSVGYARLVETLFGESLDKSATRSDWVARPLTAEQERYALDDIRFLQPLYEWVFNNLEVRGLTDALAQETERFAEDLKRDDPSGYYLRVRGGWTLSAPEQWVLQGITEWREQECRMLDKPRNRVLSDALILAIISAAPQTTAELHNVQGLPRVVVKRYGEVLLEWLNTMPATVPADFELIRCPLTRDEQALYKQVKRQFVAVAERRDIPVELLAPRRRLEAVVQSRDLNGVFTEGWRAPLIEPIRQPVEALLTS